MQDCLDKLRLWQLWEQAVTGMKPSLQVLQHLLLPSFISNVTGPVKPKAFQDIDLLPQFRCSEPWQYGPALIACSQQLSQSPDTVRKSPWL